MAFSVSVLPAGVMTDHGRYAVASTGAGSFTTNPQVLIDGFEHRVPGAMGRCDGRRMGAR